MNIIPKKDEIWKYRLSEKLVFKNSPAVCLQSLNIQRWSAYWTPMFQVSLTKNKPVAGKRRQEGDNEAPKQKLELQGPHSS